MTLTEYEVWYRKKYRRTSSALHNTFIVFSDLMAVMLSFGIGFFLVNLYDYSAINFRSFVTYWPYLPIFIIVFWVPGRLYPGLAQAPAEEFRRICITSLIVHGGIIFSHYIEKFRFDAISAAFIVSFVFSMIVLIIFRNAMRSFLSWTNLGNIPAVVFGAGTTGRAIIDRILRSKSAGYVPVLILDDRPESGDEYRNIPILHDMSLGPKIAARFKIRMAIVVMPEINADDSAELFNNSVSAFRYHVFMPAIFNNIGMHIRDFGGILGMFGSNRLTMFWNQWIKRLIDILLVFLGGSIILPFLLVLSLLIKLNSPGPVFYTQTRIGRNGRHFKVYKFRSMYFDAEERLQALLASNPALHKEWALKHKLKEDPRITSVGKFIRRMSIDELPQLINVLKGEMSLVGPRPIVDEEIKKYSGNFRRVFSIRPGITGLWQVSGRSNTDYAERVSLDVYYLESWSLWLDIWVLYKTIGVVLIGKGAY
jgi:Undecaprenyl-phosphate galactose phosphotransferase WbaP